MNLYHGQMTTELALDFETIINHNVDIDLAMFRWPELCHWDEAGQRLWIQRGSRLHIWLALKYTGLFN